MYYTLTVTWFQIPPSKPDRELEIKRRRHHQSARQTLRGVQAFPATACMACIDRPARCRWLAPVLSGQIDGWGTSARRATKASAGKMSSSHIIAAAPRGRLVPGPESLIVGLRLGLRRDDHKLPMPSPTGPGHGQGPGVRYDTTYTYT